MARYWSDRQLDRITPPQVADARGKSVLRALDQLIADRPISDLYVRDPDTCPAEALPALIAEYSLEEFIEPGLPLHVQRRIVKNAWQLQSLEGYDAGVKLGLALLGVDAQITQWYRMEPMGAANTHRIDVWVDEILWPETGGYFDERQINAIRRMIKATKRFSQDTELRIGVAARGRSFVGVYSTTMLRVTAPAFIDPPPVIKISAKSAVAPTVHINATAGAAQ